MLQVRLNPTKMNSTGLLGGTSTLSLFNERKIKFALYDCNGKVTKLTEVQVTSQ